MGLPSERTRGRPARPRIASEVAASRIAWNIPGEFKPMQEYYAESCPKSVSRIARIQYALDQPHTAVEGTDKNLRAARLHVKQKCQDRKTFMTISRIRGRSSSEGRCTLPLLSLCFTEERRLGG